MLKHIGEACALSQVGMKQGKGECGWQGLCPCSEQQPGQLIRSILPPLQPITLPLGWGAKRGTAGIVVHGVSIMSLRVKKSIQVLILESYFLLLFCRNQRDAVKSCWKASALLASRLGLCCRAPGSGVVGYLQTVWFLKVMQGSENITLANSKHAQRVFSAV